MMYIGYIIMYISHDHPEYKRYRFSIVFPLIFQMISEQTAPFQPGPCRMPQPAVSAAEIMCRHCGRYFNPEAAERHIPICANVPWVSSVILGYPWGVDQNPWWLMISVIRLSPIDIGDYNHKSNIGESSSQPASISWNDRGILNDFEHC
jgi:hypothetical protein